MIPAAVLRVCGRPPSIEERRPPVPHAGEVPITVAAAPITPLDVLCASGTRAPWMRPTRSLPSTK